MRQPRGCHQGASGRQTVYSRLPYHIAPFFQPLAHPPPLKNATQSPKRKRLATDTRRASRHCPLSTMSIVCHYAPLCSVGTARHCALSACARVGGVGTCACGAFCLCSPRLAKFSRSARYPETLARKLGQKRSTLSQWARSSPPAFAVLRFCPASVLAPPTRASLAVSAPPRVRLVARSSPHAPTAATLHRKPCAPQFFKHSLPIAPPAWGHFASLPLAQCPPQSGRLFFFNSQILYAKVG